MKKPELLAPAGSMESLYAAIEAGCDAVYLSGYMFGARQFATNFSEDELIEAINLCHLYGIKVYVTVNTLIYEDEVHTFLNYIDFLHKNNVDAVLIQDIGMLDLVRQTYPNLEVHASTQMHIHNQGGIKFCEEMGIKRVVLARETTIKNIRKFKKETNLELEVFVHGALCISYSGQCLMSSLIGGRSGNRGACAGSCRLPYQIVDSEHHKYNHGNYPLSTKDLNTLEHIGALIEAGVDSLKIEGRMKRPEYVYLVVSLYRKAIDSYFDTGKVDIYQKDIYELQKVFHRGFTKGFLFSEKNKDFIQSFRPNHLGITIGEIIDFKNGYVTVKLLDDLNIGDGVRILENDIGCTITNLFMKREKIKSGKKGDVVSFRLDGQINKGNTLVKTTDKKQLENIQNRIKQKSRKVPIFGKIEVKKCLPLTITLTDNNSEIVIKGNVAQEATKYPLKEFDIRKQIDRLGNTIYYFENLIVDMDNDCYVSIKELNDIRREAIESLNVKRCYQIPYIKKDYSRNVKNFPNLQEKSFLINDKRIYEEVIKKEYSTIYIENRELFETFKQNSKVICKLPRVIENSNTLDDSVMISELGSLRNKNKKVSDFSLNVVNSYSVALLHFLEVDKVTLSYELTFEQIKKLIDEYEKRYKVHPNLEIIGYSRVEAMVMKYDIYNTLNTNKQLFLEDKFNNLYPIKNKNGYTYILNYKKNILENSNKYYKIGVNSIRYQFDDFEDYLKYNKDCN